MYSLRVKNRFLTIMGLMLFSICLLAQDGKSDEVIAYINQYKDIAIEEMIRTGVPASIKLAQGILESGAGKSTLSLMSNNHFGVKCKGEAWTGEKVYFDDDEKGECFRKYDHPKHSYRDQSNFLAQNQRYSFLFDLNILDYKGWSNGLKKAGYATNPKYPETLINLIEKYDLQQYCYEGLYRQNRISEKDYNEYMATASKNIPSGGGNVAGNAVVALPSSSPSGKYSGVKSASELNLAGKIKSEQNNMISSMKINEVAKINSTKAVKVKPGTSLIAIALENNIDYEDLLNINNIDNNQELTNNEKETIIYLKRKKAKSKTADYHLINTEKTLADVSQMEGVNLESLMRLNPGVSSNQMLKENQVVWLK